VICKSPNEFGRVGHPHGSEIEAGELNILVTTIERLKTVLKCRWDDLLD
jgi:hypothetical protein